MDTILRLDHVTKRYAHNSTSSLTILDNVSLDIRDGEFFVFVGPSGSGKSTLLRVMSGLDQADEGQVTLAPRMTRRDMSFVFQQFALLPWFTVEENVRLGLTARGVNETGSRERAMRALKTFTLTRFARSYPRELSGGMRQRVGIARALVTNPKIIFMDEPFSELDSFTADELRQELLAIWHKEHPTIVLVTHIIEEAILLADRIAVLTPRPGRIEAVVRNILPRPRVERSRAFYRLEDRLTALVKP